MNFRSCLALSLLPLLLAAPIQARDINKVNGAIRIEQGETARDLSTVNGSIRTGAGVQLRGAKTVNGGIQIGHDNRLESAETVNGAISVGERARVAEELKTVNGGIRVGAESEVLGRVGNVNGGLVLESAVRAGSVRTYRGDVSLEDGVVVLGDLEVLEPRGVSWGSRSSRAPRIQIGPNVQIVGRLVAEHEIELRVHSSARIGAIEGATPEYYGDQQRSVE